MAKITSLFIVFFSICDKKNKMCLPQCYRYCFAASKIFLQFLRSKLKSIRPGSVVLLYLSGTLNFAILNLVYQLSILFLKSSVFDGPKKSLIRGSDVRKVLTSYNNVRFEK